jgi:MFS family permease
VLLVVLRLMQGFSASGEQSGGNSLTLEHAPDERRAFFSSFTLSGTQAGLVIATAAWLPIGAMPEDDLLSWGWRIPFFLSAIVVAAGVLIRRRLDETPVFEEAAREGEIEQAPLGELLRDHRAGVLRVILVALGSTVSTIFAVYALSFAVDTKGLDKTTMLWVAIVTNVVALLAIPAWAALADRVGRKPVLIGGALGSGALMFAYLAAIDSKSYVLIFVAAVLMSGVVYSAFNGVQPALYGEMFPTKVRLSGMAIGTQIGYAIGGFAPTAAAAIDGGGWVPVAIYVGLSSVIAAIAAASARETCRMPLQHLDDRRTQRFARGPVPAETTAAR